MQFNTWDEFRCFKSMKFSECWYRHLHCMRDSDFLEKSQRFINKIREEPLTIMPSDEDMGKVSKTQQKLFKSGELVAQFFK